MFVTPLSSQVFTSPSTELAIICEHADSASRQRNAVTASGINIVHIILMIKTVPRLKYPNTVLTSKGSGRVSRKNVRKKDQQEMTELQQRHLQEKDGMRKKFECKCKELMASAAALTIDKSEVEITQTQQKLNYADTVRKLQNELLDAQKEFTKSKNTGADIQSQPEAADADLISVVEKYEERLTEASQKLLDHEEDQHRYAVSLCDVKIELRKSSDGARWL